MIEIVDRNGNPVSMTWQDAQSQYGLSLTRATPPEGAAVFRLVRLVYDSTAETSWRLYVVDEGGRPLAGVAAYLGIRPPSGNELPTDAAPRLSETFHGQPQGEDGHRLPNRALLLQPNELNFTNLDGYIQHSLGAGSNYIPPGPATHWAWIMPGEKGYFSDVPVGFGMWDNHRMFWPVFQRQSTADSGGGAGGEEEVASGADLAEVVKQLVRIADAVEYMVSHWPTP